MITIAIVEDDLEIREVLSQYLDSQRDCECPLAVESVEELLPQLAEGVAPHVILMDIGLPGMSGISGIRMIKNKYPDMDIVMLTVHNDSHKIFESLSAGASGYLLKNTPLPEIAEAVRMLYDGGAPMSPQIARKVIDHFAPQRMTRSSSPLSPREEEIVIGLVDGLSYKLIADRLHISTETVRFHIKSIYRKLHVHSKAEVITKSLRGEI